MISVYLMAPTSRIQEYVDVESSKLQGKEIEVPVFFKRQKIEQELRESVQQKELLIQEVHHRVKNNLQVISSLLRLQMDNLSDDVFKDEFESTNNRVMTMAAVHELMYQKKDFDKVNMRTYIWEIAESLIQLYKISDTVSVELSIDIEDQNVDLERSIPLALILNEVICNAFKHGLKDGGSFFLRVSKENERFILEIGDTGPGFDDDEFVGKLGLALIDILCEQIDAEKKVNNSKNGVIYTISFKIDE
jgi:two-component sensor histidine kinase